VLPLLTGKSAAGLEFSGAEEEEEEEEETKPTVRVCLCGFTCTFARGTERKNEREEYR